MSNIAQLTVVSTDGASEVVRTTTNTVAQATEVLRGLTGVDLRQTVDDAIRGGAVGKAADDLAERLRKRREDRAARAAAAAAVIGSAPLTGGGTLTPETPADRAGISAGSAAAAAAAAAAAGTAAATAAPPAGGAPAAGAPVEAPPAAGRGGRDRRSGSTPTFPAPAATPAAPAVVVSPAGPTTSGPTAGGGTPPVDYAALDAALERAGLLDDVRRMARLAREVPGVGLLSGTSVDAVVNSGALPAVVVKALGVLPTQARTEVGRLSIEEFFRHYAG
jgi:hypothetical protein